MPTIHNYKGFIPKIAEDAFIADNATIIGEVEVGSKSSIWFQTVLRGDVGLIKIGEYSNIQDGCVVHCSTGRTPTLIGDYVVVGHRAILHGCTIEEEALIGMGAIVMDEAIVPKHCIIAAGALVPERKQLESGFLYAGIPAKKIKPLTEIQIAQIRKGAESYVKKGEWYKERALSSKT